MAEVLIQSDSPADGRGITDSVWAATSANEAIVYVVITTEVVRNLHDVVLLLCYFWMDAWLSFGDCFLRHLGADLRECKKLALIPRRRMSGSQRGA